MSLQFKFKCNTIRAMYGFIQRLDLLFFFENEFPVPGRR